MMRVAAALIGLAAVLSLIVYPRLSERVPIHWNAAGHVDGYAPRLEAVVVVPIAMLAVAAIFAVIPRRVTPRTHDVIFCSLLVLLFVVHVWVLFAGVSS